MKKGLFLAAFLFLATSNIAYGKRVPLKSIQTVDIFIYDQNSQAKDGDQSEFVLSVYINGTEDQNYVTSFMTSVGMLADRYEEGKKPELTPEGSFYPQRLIEDHVSSQFDSTALFGTIELGAMPFSIFFHRGFAIHGSRGTVDGRPASKGCVRLKVAHAKKLFGWVQAAIANSGSNQAVRIQIADTESAYVARYRRPKGATQVHSR